MPSPDGIMRTIYNAVEAFRNTPGRRGRIIYLERAVEVLVAGDIHGNLRNFRRVLDRAKLRENPLRHLVFQELVHGSYDYPGGGEKSHQLIDLLAALKCEYPLQVHMLLGNHELAQWADQKIAKGDRDPTKAYREGVQTAYGDRSDDIYAAYMQLFAVLPVAIRTANRVFLSHSLPTPRRMATFDPLVIHRESNPDKELHNGGSIHSLVWGRDTSAANVAAFLEMVDADLLITGHLPVENGYHFPNDRQLILDTMRDGDAACCMFPANRMITQRELLEGIASI